MDRRIEETLLEKTSHHYSGHTFSAGPNTFVTVYGTINILKILDNEQTPSLAQPITAIPTF